MHCQAAILGNSLNIEYHYSTFFGKKLSSSVGGTYMFHADSRPGLGSRLGLGSKVSCTSLVKSHT